MNKAFVLGGSGFLGNYLIEEVINAGSKISALVHNSSLSHLKEHVSIHRGSLTDFDWKNLEGDLPDVIYHSARMSGTDRKSRLKAAHRNKKANERLLEWLHSLDKPPLLVYVSGTLVYGSHAEKQIDESCQPQPISFQKQYFEAEKPILKAMHPQKIPLIIVRPSWIYGIGSWFQAFYLNYMQKKQKVPLYGHGDNLMAFIHVRDAAAMMIYAANNYHSNAIYNLFTCHAIPQREFSEELAYHSELQLTNVPAWWLRIRFDKAVSEAFRFSLNLTTKHYGLWENYHPYYPRVKDWIADIFKE